MLAPQNEEIAIGAITESGDVYLNNEIITELKISQDYIKKKTRQLEEIKCQNLRFHQSTSISLEDSIQGNIVVLIDDRVASGATLTAALRYIKGHTPIYIIIGIPIAPRETVNMIKNEAHKDVSIFARTNHKFVSVEQYYLNFNPVTDFQVIQALRSR